MTIQGDSLTRKGIVDRRAAYLAGTSRSVGRGQTHSLLPTRIYLYGCCSARMRSLVNVIC
ncbi:MAG: hypothetical protein RBS30_08770, partial [Sphaerochaetaceae bacterium]|nr:hypothetical protein [Sphaerochaetaceae bacterium]